MTRRGTADFASRLTAWRAGANLTKFEAASLYGVDDKTLTSWERGGRPREHELRAARYSVETYTDNVHHSIREKFAVAISKGHRPVEEFIDIVDDELKRQLISRWHVEPATTSGDTITVFKQAPPDEKLRFERALLRDLELALRDARRRPLSTSLPYPAFVTRPWRYQLRRQAQMYSDPAFRSLIVRVLKQRYRAWHRLAAVASIQWLIEPASHLRYLQAVLRGDPPLATPSEIRGQIQETRRLLACYPNLEIRLATGSIPTIMSLFGGVSATIFGNIAEPSAEGAETGVRGVIITDPSAVRELRNTFDEDWKRADGDDRHLEAFLRRASALL